MHTIYCTCVCARAHVCPGDLSVTGQHPKVIFSALCLPLPSCSGAGAARLLSEHVLPVVLLGLFLTWSKQPSHSLKKISYKCMLNLIFFWFYLMFNFFGPRIPPRTSHYIYFSRCFGSSCVFPAPGLISTFLLGVLVPFLGKRCWHQDLDTRCSTYLAKGVSFPLDPVKRTFLRKNVLNREQSIYFAFNLKDATHCPCYLG